MSITRENYEVYFIDFLDGNLSPALEEELKEFLLLHPGLAEELECFEKDLTLSSEEVKIDKSGLKNIPFRHLKVNEKNVDNYLIAKNEGDLNLQEISELSDYLQLNPKAKKEGQLYNKVFLKADLSVRFPQKNSLKRRFVAQRKKITLYASSAAAAVVLLFVLVYQPWNRTANEGGQVFVSNETKVQPVQKHHVDQPLLAEKEGAEIEIQDEAKNYQVINPSPPKIEKTTVKEDIKLKAVQALKASAVHFDAEDVEPLLKGYTPSNYFQQSTKDYTAKKARQIPTSTEDIAFALLELGIKGYNLLTENNAQFQRTTTEDGRTDLALNSEVLGFQAKLKK
jgi:hypothetical protein